MKKFGMVLCLWIATAIAGVGTIYRYDDVGRLGQVIYPQGKTIQYRYDARGNMLEKRVTQLCYDYQLLSAQWPAWPTPNNIQNFVGIVSCLPVPNQSKLGQ